jgi:hypothetical protein
MPYFTITDFAGGLDLRRNSLAAPAGTMRSMINCHITPGGEVEKRLAFVPFATLPAASRGLVSLNDMMFTYMPSGSPLAQVNPTWRWTIGTQYLNTASLAEVIDWDIFDGQLFTITTTAANDIEHFYGTLANKITDVNCKGFFCRTFKEKMYTVGGSSMFFSVPFDPKTWTNNPDPSGDPQGAGSIDLSANDSDMVECMSIELYFDKIAIMSKEATQLWHIDPDPLQNSMVQTIRNAGTVAYKSVLGYGSGDVLFLAPDGIRSLRARNSSLAASAADIGSPIDPVLQEIYQTVGDAFLAQAIAMVQPVTGRFWMILPDRIYVLSAFPGPKITAWSEYWPVDAAGLPITITDVAIFRKTIIVRSIDHKVYAYGGPGQAIPLDTSSAAVEDGTQIAQNVYDASPVELEFPFHGGDNPATKKTFVGIDATCTGEWEVYAAFNPEAPDAEDYIGKLIGPTFEQGRLPMVGTGTHLSLRLRSSVSGPITLSNLIIHYQVGEAS